MASDNLNENYTTIVIHVNDVNDNPPVFDRPTYETQITEEDDRMLPKRVLQVEKSQKHNSHSCFCLFSSLFPFYVLFYIPFILRIFSDSHIASLEAEEWDDCFYKEA